MKRDPFLSIIMPVYKAEPYLRTSLDSMREQTFTDWELILIDDGSPDRCGEICEEYARGDERISVIHMPENRGVIATRNEAMKQARGHYVTFMDSDDQMAKDTYQRTCDAAVEHGCPDVVVFGLVEEYYDKNHVLRGERTVSLPSHYFATKEELRPYVIELEKSLLYGFLWNKLYDLTYIKEHDITIPAYPLASDFFFNCKFFMDIDSMLVLSDAPYIYNRRVDEGLTSRFFPQFYDIQRDRVQWVLEQYEQWGLCTDAIKSDLSEMYLRQIFASLQRFFDPRMELNGKKRRARIRAIFAEDLYQKIMPYCHPENRMLKVLNALVRTRRASLVDAAAHAMYTIKRINPLLFNRIKQNR